MRPDFERWCSEPDDNQQMTGISQRVGVDDLTGLARKRVWKNVDLSQASKAPFVVVPRSPILTKVSLS